MTDMTSSTDSLHHPLNEMVLDLILFGLSKTGKKKDSQFVFADSSQEDVCKGYSLVYERMSLVEATFIESRISNNCILTPAIAGSLWGE